MSVATLLDLARSVHMILAALPPAEGMQSLQEDLSEVADRVAACAEGSTSDLPLSSMARFRNACEILGEVAASLTAVEKHLAAYLAALGMTSDPSQGGEPGVPAGAHDGWGGWDDPAVKGHPSRLDPAAIHLTAARRGHVLDGEMTPYGPSGGHRHGTGHPGKTEFPASWADDIIIARTMDVCRRPDTPPHQQPSGRWVVRGVRAGVAITAVIDPDGGIVTAYPTDGPGVVQNPT